MPLEDILFIKLVIIGVPLYNINDLDYLITFKKGWFIDLC